MRYTIFAGVNGAGKSSLYSVLSRKEKEMLGVRINVDDIVSSMGDWHDDIIQLKAARIAVKRIQDCLANHTSFNQETTLSGKNILNTIKKAKDERFEIYMYYVFVHSVDIAKQRIKDRIKKGGHGIPDDVVERRFIHSFEILKEAIPLCNRIVLYDNTQSLTNAAIIEQGKIVAMRKDIVGFMRNLIEETCNSHIEK